MTKLDYIPGTSIIPPDATGISPSRLHEFFSKPHQWYRTEVLGEDGFTGSTASVLGTIVHFVAESFTKEQKVDKTEIWRYIYDETSNGKREKQLAKLLTTTEEQVEEFLIANSTNPEINAEQILFQYKNMGNDLIQHLRTQGLPERSEQLVKAEILPGYYVCGSADAVRGTTLVDYKTTSDKSLKDTIPYNYKLQLLCYAYMYRKMGVHIDTISITWIRKFIDGGTSLKTGKPLKSYPVETKSIFQTITNEDIQFIEDLLKLVAESLEASKLYPHLRHIIWKDYRLLEKKV